MKRFFKGLFTKIGKKSDSINNNNGTTQETVKGVPTGKGIPKQTTFNAIETTKMLLGENLPLAGMRYTLGQYKKLRSVLLKNYEKTTFHKQGFNYLLAKFLPYIFSLFGAILAFYGIYTFFSFDIQNPKLQVIANVLLVVLSFGLALMVERIKHTYSNDVSFQSVKGGGLAIKGILGLIMCFLISGLSSGYGFVNGEKEVKVNSIQTETPRLQELKTDLDLARQNLALAVKENGKSSKHEEGTRSYNKERYRRNKAIEAATIAKTKANDVYEKERESLIVNKEAAITDFSNNYGNKFGLAFLLAFVLDVLIFTCVYFQKWYENTVNIESHTLGLSVPSIMTTIQSGLDNLVGRPQNQVPLLTNEKSNRGIGFNQVPTKKTNPFLDNDNELSKDDTPTNLDKYKLQNSEETRVKGFKNYQNPDFNNAMSQGTDNNLDKIYYTVGTIKKRVASYKTNLRKNPQNLTCKARLKYWNYLLTTAKYKDKTQNDDRIKATEFVLTEWLTKDEIKGVRDEK